MLNWVWQAIDGPDPFSWGILSVRLAVSLLLGMVVVAIYRATRRAASISATFPATLVLLTILIAMMTQVIGNNQALAFSLVGALSVVRFRTVVRDTKDTAFVIVAVMVGMATGTGQTTVAICGLVAVTIAAYLFRDRATFATMSNREMILSLKLVWSAALEQQIIDTLTRLNRDVEPLSAGTIKQGTGLELSYRLLLLPTTTLTQLVSDLSRLEGVQGVDLKKDKDDA